MSDRGNGMLLIVVRWQPVILRADEGFEERPGLARRSAEKRCLVSRQPGRARRSGRLIHQAIAGAANQRNSTGPATVSAAGADAAT